MCIVLFPHIYVPKSNQTSTQFQTNKMDIYKNCMGLRIVARVFVGKSTSLEIQLKYLAKRMVH